MAMICDKCGGIIPDESFDGDSLDCENHFKPDGMIHHPLSNVQWRKSK
jgi:hypothetical protein